ITISHKVVNESGVTTVKPFVIDGPIAVMVRTDVEGVDLGFRGCLNPDEDKMPAAKVMVEKDGKVYNFTYSSSVSVPLYFTALFDGVKVKKDEDCNKVIFDNTGKAISEAVVYTAFPWYDFADGTTNVNLSGEAVYGFDELPDWVHLDAVDVSQWKSKDNRASNILKFSCDPLPQGVNSRMAEVRVVGRGVQSEDVIVLLQDEVAGISDVHTSNNAQVYKPAYNISGQRVSKNYKGVILREGKKYLNK
ncbi:MAG: hypothetical protein Q3994_05490, partial [Prevotella sp.]|nr:hypothetical protein [Prevotella sp.]